MRVAIVDYGAGNIASVQNALLAVGAEGILVDSPARLLDFARVIVPGVGAFGAAMQALRARGFEPALRDYAQSTCEGENAMFGICLGMQLLFDVSYEFGEHRGLGIVAGEVVPLQGAPKIPHMGWNRLHFVRDCALNVGLAPSEFLYFVHSYCVKPRDSAVIWAQTDYGQTFVSAIAQNRIYGLQPHPEKSHNIGLKILENFIKN